MSKSIINTIEKDKLQEIINSQSSYVDVLRVLGMGVNNYKTLMNRIDKDNLDSTTLSQNRKKIVITRKKRTIAEIAKKDTCIKSMRSFKKRLIDEGHIPFICSKCDNKGEWMGKKLVLQLEHIDGNKMNNDLSNLTFLCPNCHSQTSTFAGKNRKSTITQQKVCGKCTKNISPTATYCRDCVEIPLKFEVHKSELEDMIFVKNMTYVAIGKHFGVTDNSIRKRCKRLGIVLPVRRYGKKS